MVKNNQGGLIVEKIVQCVPNFSEGRDHDKIEKIVEPFRQEQGVDLRDYTNDIDHNRMVVTVTGEPSALKEALVKAIGTAIECIDMRNHEGQHPRMGAVDVVPFIPIQNMSMDEAVELSKEVAALVAEKYELPVFLYGESASNPDRDNLPSIRKGQFEGMGDKIKDARWKPDFGPQTIHPTAGVTAMGARLPLIAFNVNLGTDDLKIADKIAKKIRYISGGLRYCRAIGVALEDKGIVQVSINLTNYTKTSIYQVFELVGIEAKRYGVNVVGSEIVGQVPVEALVDAALYYLRTGDFTANQLIDARFML